MSVGVVCCKLAFMSGAECQVVPGNPGRSG